MESGGGGLVSTTMDYARFCQMLLNGGALDGMRIIGRKTLQLMASDHLGPHVKIQGDLVPAGHSFGLGFAVRTEQGIASFAGSVGQFFWSGMGGTFFWIDPVEDLFAVFMSQAPGVLHQRSGVSDRAASEARSLAARELAEEHFAAETVVASLMGRAGL